MKVYTQSINFNASATLLDFTNSLTEYLTTSEIEVLFFEAC